MKRKKINKAIKVLKEFCDTRSDDCLNCPFKHSEVDYYFCKLSTIPACWKELKGGKE